MDARCRSRVPFARGANTDLIPPRQRRLELEEPKCNAICFEEKHLPAVIRLCGSRAALERAVLKCTLPFTEAVQCQRERRLNPDREHPETTFNLTVSEACGDSVPQQIRDVEDFLAADGRLITDLIRSVEGSSCIIDFSWDLPSHAIGQSNRFGSSLLSKLAELKIELEISVYGTASEAEE